MSRPSIMKASLLLIAAGTLAGCATTGASTSGEPGSRGSGTPGGAVAAPMAEVAPANPADAHFMSGMIHHHAQALVMAELAQANGGGPSVRNLAERIRVSQTDEIRMMQNWLRGKGEPVPQIDGSVEGEGAGDAHEGHGGHGGHDLMPGMLTEGQMEELAAARGAEFDRLFLLYMIQHHEGAITMVEDLFSSHGGGNDDFIYKMATDAFADQGAEIDRMQRMLDAMEGEVRR